MKYVFLFCLLFSFTVNIHAQEQTSKLLQETAKTLLQKGDIDNAVIMLERAKQQDPDNIELLRDYCFALYLKRDFAKAIEVGKELVEKPNADQQSFQVLGLAYKATAAYKESGKLYRTALRKFPASGVIYNEYAEVFALENDLEEAIIQWEKGIELDPGYSSNYYNATMYYVKTKNWLRACIYGEIFMNLESYSTRSTEIRDNLLESYKNIVSPAYLQQSLTNKKITGFEKTLLDIFSKINTTNGKLNGMNDLISLRTRFLLEWLQGKEKIYPFRLFDKQNYLVSQGIFEAYNYWLFSNAAGESVYKDWQKAHQKEYSEYTTYQQSRVFKLSVGQYYF